MRRRGGFALVALIFDYEKHVSRSSCVAHKAKETDATNIEWVKRGGGDGLKSLKKPGMSNWRATTTSLLQNFDKVHKLIM